MAGHSVQKEFSEGVRYKFSTLRKVQFSTLCGSANVSNRGQKNSDIIIKLLDMVH